MMTRRTLLALTSAAALLPAKAAIPVLSVSEVLQELDSYSGKVLAIVGRLNKLNHGLYLDEDGWLLIPGELPPMGHPQGWGKAFWLAPWKPLATEPPSLPTLDQLPPALVQRKWEQVKQTTKLRVIEIAPENRHLVGGRARLQDQWAVAVGCVEAGPKQEIRRGGKTEILRAGVGHLASCVAQLLLRGDNSLRVLS